MRKTHPSRPSGITNTRHIRAARAQVVANRNAARIALVHEAALRAERKAGAR